MNVTIKQLQNNSNEFANQKVTISGWVRNNRDQKTYGFLKVADGTSLTQIQIVYENTLSNFERVTKISVGSSVEITGEFILTPERKQPFEIKAAKVKLITDAGSDYPIQAKQHTREFLRTKLELRPRTNLYYAIFKTRSVMAQAVHEFFAKKGFIYVHTPIITHNDGEGAGQLFSVTTNLDAKNPTDFQTDFFKKRVYLSVSGQLQAEAYAQAFRNVYTFGPTFRAERSNTPKHAAEFWMIEPEMAFADLAVNMQVVEEMVKFLIKVAFERLPEELTLFDQFVEPGLRARLTHVLESKFAHVTHKEAIDILKQAQVKFENKPEYGGDIATEHEKYLTDVHFKLPVFITDWPKEIKAFYMKQNKDGETVAAMDLLVSKSGELVGGSQREESYPKLLKRMKELNMNIDSLKWYLDLRKYGGTVSSGFGMGFERLIMFITGVDNIRDVLPFPRTDGHCEQ